MRLQARLLRLALAGLLALGLQASPILAGEVHVVKIFNNTFTPRNLTVHVGDHVRFQNWDPEPHRATASDGSWTSGPIAAAGGVTIAVISGMKASYACLYHPGMRGMLKVLK